ncbi:RusA family crossover junction endodeoxyribonuclease [Bacillus paralicheniformis]|uniref:RusA family crossover junction endodeoxyribonuclease n=1 Tax=Bacillus paralicheniformis TaxID=1648923 RepID=UPI00203CEA23|nr:RusA family crossover junction endodeoxyribonuclease [Bacillus paralicheniformis]MCM3425595.1 RusA family crossover junction endodeoxyribonuclease [Bacillus paralicheniformis]
MITLNIPVEPMGAVRMTGRGKFVKPNAKRYLSYKDFIKFKAKEQLKGQEFFTGPIEVEILFLMPIPKSWAKWKKRVAPGKRHTVKPDIDNLIKGVFDALNQIAWMDDNQVSEVTACKRYSENPGITVRITRAAEVWEKANA